MLDRLERYRLPFVFFAFFLLTAAVWVLVERAHDDARPLELVAEDAPPGGLKVDVTGAVNRPGVYRFQPGARLADAVEAAGGPTADAATSALNMAARLRDEQRLLIPTRGQLEELRRTGATTAAGALGAAQPGLVDINRADQRTLESLPGIGAVRARRIIDSRSAEGPFFQPDDLVERNIVPRSVFDPIRDRLVAVPP